MLGMSAQNLKFQTINDFCSPADYLDYMFGGMQGVIYRATIDPKYHQNFYRASGLIKARYKGVDNCYVSMNTFYRTKDLDDEQKGRDVPHLKRLNALYVDIDCYKIGLSKGETFVRLKDEFFDTKIPVPTFVNDSGRGLTLIWKLRNEDKKALPRWTAVQEYLTEELEELGADHACTDAARIFRVPFSRNPKSNSYVKILDFNDVTYSLYDITKEYGIKPKRKPVSGKDRKKHPYNHATERQRKYVRDIANRLKLQEESYPDFTDFHETDNWIKLHKDLSVTQGDNKGYCYEKGNIYSLSEFKSIKKYLSSCCEEIRKLFSMRKGADCKRELALFLYRYFLREMKYDSDSALEKTLSFNASLDCPFEESYVSTVTSSADRRIESGIPYAYKKSTIIKILEITKDELKELPFFSAGAKSRKESNRRAYEKRLVSEGKVAKKDALLKRRASILSMQKQGCSASQIMDALQISRATYHRDIAALATESVLVAVNAFLEVQAGKLSQGIKKAAVSVSNAVEDIGENGMPATILSIHSFFRKTKTRAVSHFLSIPFIGKHSFAVPHSPVYFSNAVDLLHWLVCRRRTCLKDSDSEDDSRSG